MLANEPRRLLLAVLDELGVGELDAGGLLAGRARFSGVDRRLGRGRGAAAGGCEGCGCEECCCDGETHPGAFRGVDDRRRKLDAGWKAVNAEAI
jgi:hypothetical protein